MLTEDFKNRVARYFTIDELAAFLELDMETFIDAVEHHLEDLHEELLIEMGIEDDDDKPQGLDWD